WQRLKRADRRAERGRRHAAEAESVASGCAMVRRGMSAECTPSAALSGPFARGALLVRLTHSNVPGDSSTTVVCWHADSRTGAPLATTAHGYGGKDDAHVFKPAWHER